MGVKAWIIESAREQNLSLALVRAAIALVAARRYYYEDVSDTSFAAHEQARAAFESLGASEVEARCAMDIAGEWEWAVFG